MSKKDTFDPYDFNKIVFQNTPIYYKEFPTSPCIYINICFNTGAMHDPENIVGISHFLEHMIFDGSPKLKDKKTIKEWSKINTLNTWNAWTFFTNTNYHLKCLPEKFDIVLEGMEDMIFNPLLREEDIEHERKVITQEAWGRYKNEKLLKYVREMLDNSYHGTLRNKTFSPLGWPETISKITREDVSKWHKENYGKGNFFVVISGNIDKSHIEKIQSLINRLPKAKNSKYNFRKISKPKKLEVTKNSEDIGDPTEQVEISFARVLSSKDAGNEEVSNISTSLLSDILYERLRTERALCYSVSVGAHSQRDFVTWGAALRTKEEEVDTVKKEFWKALDDIKKGKEKNRFEIVKQVRIDRLKSLEEVTGDFTNEALNNIWRFGKVIPKNKMLSDRSKVKYSDVVKCINKAFDEKWTLTEVILPSKK